MKHDANCAEREERMFEHVPSSLDRLTAKRVRFGNAHLEHEPGHVEIELPKGCEHDAEADEGDVGHLVHRHCGEAKEDGHTKDDGGHQRLQK